MIQIPRLRFNGTDKLVVPYDCGRTACDNEARSFWQSRMSIGGQVAELPDLVDLRELAKSLRQDTPLN